MGFEVIEMSECVFLEMLKKNPRLRKELENDPIIYNAPLNPRDAFYGGRTEATKIYYKCKENEKIKYIDVCSLYPYVCKNGFFPIKHPQIYVGDECKELDLKKLHGVIKCRIIPNSELYHPVLPLKLHDKLFFPLCYSCCLELNQEECTHTDDQKAIVGTWVIAEVVKAIEMGYIIAEIYEVWDFEVKQYNTKTGDEGLFTEMMNKFLKIKQEASGWPLDCKTEDEKTAYINKYYETEGVMLDRELIEKNAGLRAFAKLCLNETLLVNYDYKNSEDCSSFTSNVLIGAFTTTQARLKLYSYLEKLGESVIYCDTDSVVYIAREGQYEPETGEFLGMMTDELECKGKGSYITEFVTGGPKNYSYKVYSTDTKQIETECKVKGFKLTQAISQKINFETIKNMVIQKEKRNVKVTINNIKRTNDHRVLSTTNEKIYQVVLNKRVFSDDDSRPYGYKKKLKK
uniref:DNA-directed DNA polymerase n=1 Tax=Culicoides sonorensis TaxID=179676 RepID=A0A336M8F1_CULSO